MNQYKIGDLVYASLGTLPVVGTVVDFHAGRGSISSGSARSSRTGTRRRR